MPHHHFPKVHCSNDDVILSNYHHHSFRSLPTYVDKYDTLEVVEIVKVSKFLQHVHFRVGPCQQSKSS